jgi:hypothetical protein
LILVVTGASLYAQEAGVTVSGTVTDSSGNALPNVIVSIKNEATGQSFVTQSDSAGQYTFSNLPAGNYELSAWSGGSSVVRKTTLGGSDLILLLNLAPSHGTAQALPEAPSSSKTEPSLEDLGFSKAEVQGNARQQALLDKRTHMLKIHQRMGLITAAPLIASVVTSLGAGGKSTGTTSRDLHVALGALTGDLYGITAWYAIRAPRIEGTPKRGPIRFHEAMAWIHGPGMILTPILGAIAFSQKNNGEKVHGIAQAHGPVAIVTAGAFGAALLSVSVKF